MTDHFIVIQPDYFSEQLALPDADRSAAVSFAGLRFLFRSEIRKLSKFAIWRADEREREPSDYGMCDVFSRTQYADMNITNTYVTLGAPYGHARLLSLNLPQNASSAVSSVVGSPGRRSPSLPCAFG